MSASSSFAVGNGLSDLSNEPPLHFGDDDEDNSQGDDVHEGDYSTRMEELFEEGDDDSEAHEEDEDDFVYTGMDAADTSTSTYRDQLGDVLGSEDEEEEDGDEDQTEELEVEKSLEVHESPQDHLELSVDDPQASTHNRNSN